MQQKKLEDLALELKQLCKNGNETETHLERTTKILHQFGQLYMNQSPDKISLIRSTVFFNAALTRQPTNENIQKDLEQLCSHVLKVSPACDKNADLCKISKEAKQKVNAMRKFVKEKLKLLKIIPIDISPEHLLKMEKEKIDQVQQLQDDIAQQFTEVMNFISNECVKILGNPPCSYCVVGMGSLARKEITPYSDFEHVIVLEEGVQNCKNYHEILEYFRWFSVIFQVIVINFQETIVRSVAAPFLNDDLVPGGDWFFDVYTKCGIKFDGMQIHACKFPLGRFRKTNEKNWTIELIQPISKMVKFLEKEEDEKNGFHLGDILTKVSLVSGDETVFKKFQENVNEKLIQERFSSKSEIFKQIVHDLRKFNPMERLSQNIATSICDVKRLLYRTTTLFVSALGRMAKLKQNSSFDIVTEYCKAALVSAETAHKLSYAIAVACEARLKVYMLKEGQDDMFGERNYEFNERRTTKELIELIGERSLSDYIITAFRLQKSIAKFNKERLYDAAKSKAKDVFLVLYGLDFRDRFEYEQEQYFQNDDLSAKGDSLFVLYTIAKMHFVKGEYEKAIDIFQLFDNASNADFEDAEDSEIIMYFSTLVTDALVEKTQCLALLGRDETVCFANQAIQKLQTLDNPDYYRIFNTGQLYLFKGQAQDNLGQYELAVLSFKESINHFQNSKCPNSESIIIRSYINMANSQSKIGNVTEVIESLKTVLELYSASTIEISTIADCCQQLFRHLMFINQPNEAKHYLEKELELRLQYLSVHAREKDESILLCKQQLALFGID